MNNYSKELEHQISYIQNRPAATEGITKEEYVINKKEIDCALNKAEEISHFNLPFYKLRR